MRARLSDCQLTVPDGDEPSATSTAEAELVLSNENAHIGHRSGRKCRIKITTMSGVVADNGLAERGSRRDQHYAPGRRVEVT